jgi:hypothetical protein
MPLPVPTLDCDNGWLAPDGRLFPNPEFAYHSRVAEQICQAMGIETNDPNSHLINLGWAKLREERWYIYRNDRDGELAPERLSTRQRNTIFDYCQKREKELPDYIFPKPAEAELLAA